jgi:8-oxo-dGTP pyrophosphatase MutT (NUDIX family)
MNDPRWPVSMKGVVLISSRVALVRNDRDEWELPGGRLEPGEWANWG